MTAALDILRHGLARSFSGPKTPETWSDPAAMTRVRERVQRDHGGIGIAADPRLIMEAVADFRKSGQIGEFRDLKYVCLGVGELDSTGWSVLADETLRGTVARMVVQQPSARRRLRCFQALLSSYFVFPFNGEGASEESKAGWRGLREWLRAERDRVAQLPDFKPPLWFETLLRHPELLTNQPCDKFGADLLRGDASGLNDAREGLSIPENSWVIEEAVLAQMKAASALEDLPFKAALPALLTIATGRVGITIGESLRIRCVAHLVSRYARCADRPEQPDLRDAATTTIGNPWLRRTHWDAHVRVGGKADDMAREMVFFWLKERLVSDFFELLSTEGINDRRRVAYWLRFVPFIQDMWFALGTSASSRTDDKFGEFRERAQGRLLRLEGTAADNNAFVMRIGAYLAVEFGAPGNAFYLFRWDALSPSLHEALDSGRRWIQLSSTSPSPLASLDSGPASVGIRIADLKGNDNVGRMSHADAPGALKSWEQKFDDRLIKLIGSKPERRPACVPDFEALIADSGVEVDDQRGAGGALWVYEAELSSPLARKLKKMGFAYRAGRGWYGE